LLKLTEYNIKWATCA